MSPEAAVQSQGGIIPDKQGGQSGAASSGHPPGATGSPVSKQSSSALDSAAGLFREGAGFLQSYPHHPHHL